MESDVRADDDLENQNNHISPNPLKCPPPSAPLLQMSPERMNQQRIPQSPSLHSYLNEHDRPRTRDSFTSDVQTKVAFLNSLATTRSTQSSPTRPRRAANGSSDGSTSPRKDVENSSAALQRAVMGYEEAQASLASLTAELERAREEMSSRKKRERMLSQRVEDLLEELSTEKEKRHRDQDSYTKEVKRCRKETYRAELAVVEARQDLQDTRAELKKSQAEVQHERSEKDKARQEAFERAYALAGTVGELDQVKDQLKVAEKERDSALLEAKTAQTDKDMAVEKSVEAEKRLAAQEEERDSRPATSDSSSDKDQATRAVREAIKTQWAHHSHTSSQDRPGSSGSTASTSSRTKIDRRPRLHFPKIETFENMIAKFDLYNKRAFGEKLTPQEEIKLLKQDIVYLEQKQAEDADLIHFMNMQCQFQACPCRQAEKDGKRFVHDAVYDASMQQEQASKKRKVSNKERPCLPHAKTEPPVSVIVKTPHRTPKSGKVVAPVEEPIVLPPEPTRETLAAAEEPLVLEAAVEVPLPEEDPMELDSDSTPNATAQLEEITQVLVEPTNGSKHFAFSTSVSSNAGTRAMPPPLKHTESASATMEADLFDLSPPKQMPPRRPSTAMGILSVDLPVKLVPESPKSARSSRDNTRSTFRDRNQTVTKSTTTKVALKNSPPRTTLHRRAQSRPNLRSHSPLVTSTVMSQYDESHTQPIFSKETSASPAASTVFPMTPVHKHSRSMHNFSQHPQLQAQQPQPPTTTTTTRARLRDTPQQDDVFSPEHPIHPEPLRSRTNEHHSHAQTEILNVNFNTSQSTASQQYPHSASRSTSTNSTNSAVLTNVPGTPISREAALAQIRARRDRARSVNLKKSIDGGKSPTKGVGMKPSVVNGAGGKENVRLDMRSVREISQASAPGRF